MRTKELVKIWILRLSAILLPVSMGFTVVAITLLMLGNLRMPRFSMSFLSLITGIILWYAGILLKNRVRFFFAATFLLLTSVLLFFIDFNFMYILLPVVWPILMVFVAISFTVSGFLCYHKLHAMYIVLSLAFSGLGVLFFLFSSKLITLSFITVVLWWFPVLFLLSVISLVIWLFQRISAVRDINE